MAQTDNTLPKNNSVSLWYITLMLFAFACLAFLGGYTMTTLGAWGWNYVELPTAGEIVQSAERQTFNAYYPDFRRYAIRNPETDPLGTQDSMFKQIGLFGVSLFVYAVANAWHWMLELKLQNFQAILLNPFLALLICAFLLRQFIFPQLMNGKDKAFSIPVLLALFHAIITSVIWLIGVGISPVFAALFKNPYVYEGQMIGSIVPGIFVILITNIIYGAVIGCILTFFASEQEVRVLSHPETAQSG